MRVFVGLVALATLVAAVPSPFKTKEEVYAPRGWVQRSRAAPNHNIELRIGLPQPKFSDLEKHLYEVSDPEHERYGQHLSKEEVEALVAPHQESLDAVNKWLAEFGLGEQDLVRSPAKDWITITVPVSVVESMLDTVSAFFEIDASFSHSSCLLEIPRLGAHKQRR